MTPNDFQSSKFKLGRFAKPFYVVAALFNALVFAVQVSPFYFPVTAETFNFVSPSEYNHSLRAKRLTNCSMTGWGYHGCDHHLRNIELVVHPRREVAPQGTNREGLERC